MLFCYIQFSDISDSYLNRLYNVSHETFKNLDWGLFFGIEMA